MRWLLSGGRLIDPARGLDSVADLLIEDGKIAGTHFPSPASSDVVWQRDARDARILDVRGFWVVPGLVDMHTHLREPGYEYKETVRTGSEAAAAGGFTSVACMPNTNPVNDEPSTTVYIRRQADEANLVRVYPVAAVTRGSLGDAMTNFRELAESGAVAFSDDGRPLMNALLMRKALEEAAVLQRPVIAHCEDLHLSAGGVMNEGPTSQALGLPAIPSVSEEVMVARDILLAGHTGGPLHIAHVSTAGSVRLVRDAKARGVPVTAETAPHYLFLTDDLLSSRDPLLKVNPPLRSRHDLHALRDGLRDGTIDVIATDHAPHTPADKQGGMKSAASGMIGLETALPLGLQLVREGLLAASDLIRKMSLHPARILRIPGGSLAQGAPADVTVIDPEAAWTVDPGGLHSRSRNTPFAGWSMQGRAVMTIVGGEIRHRAD